ncbi:hypothetical protein POL68_00495 [Stigmatella sp. ncwal1]|uniref:Lipoprotein n=1 Tax=Stigmatella ashevillensis TaxID=2995309 RepID=A0ABT5D033_9BACT|nr:hypothetical protein [Stigmatella ashevillena]MDC0706941.1 hypothetical protein [Stigmatella ashevillena]
MRTSFRLTLVALMGVLTFGCGEDSSVPAPSGEGDGDGSPPINLSPLLPWTAGNRWIYRVTEDGEVSEKETILGEVEAVGGTGPNRDTLANKVTTLKSSGARTLSWQAVVDSRLVRYREQSLRASTGTVKSEEHWEPAKLHVDEAPEHAVAGASWLETYEETELADGASSGSTVRERWTVLSASESVTVPAGTFEAVVLQKAGGGTAKTYWFVRGIGKVKEEGGQTEELVSYEVLP